MPAEQWPGWEFGGSDIALMEAHSDERRFWRCPLDQIGISLDFVQRGRK